MYKILHQAFRGFDLVADGVFNLEDALEKIPPREPLSPEYENAVFMLAQFKKEIRALVDQYATSLEDCEAVIEESGQEIFAKFFPSTPVRIDGVLTENQIVAGAIPFPADEAIPWLEGKLKIKIKSVISVQWAGRDPKDRSLWDIVYLPEGGANG